MFSKKATPEVLINECDCSLILRCRIKESTVCKMNCVAYRDDNYILIGDIQMGTFEKDARKNINKGYGSLLVNELLQYAKANKYEKIVGNLSIVDLNHKDRLHHFYKKFGFTITEFDEVRGNYYGSIQLDLE